MKLKDNLKGNIEIMEFLEAVKRCRGDVLFQTAEGDSLNLKSQLSEYIFLASALTNDIIQRGEIIIENPADLDYIEKFVDWI